MENTMIGYVQAPATQSNKIEPKHTFVPKAGYTGTNKLQINPDGTVSLRAQFTWDFDKPNRAGE